MNVSKHYCPYTEGAYLQGDGAGVWSVASDIMTQDQGLESEKEELAKNVAAVTYGG